MNEFQFLQRQESKMNWNLKTECAVYFFTYHTQNVHHQLLCNILMTLPDICYQ